MCMIITVILIYIKDTEAKVCVNYTSEAMEPATWRSMAWTREVWLQGPLSLHS